MLAFDENNVYRLKGTENVNGSLTQDRLGKDRIIIEADKPPKREQFSLPPIQDVTEYCREKDYRIDAEAFSGDRCRRAYEAMLRLEDSHQSVDPVTVVQK